MNLNKRICPITYEIIKPSERYSARGLRKLSSKLKKLQDFPYTIEQQIIEARKHANKMSIQGVQPKLSAILNPQKETFELCDTGGTYILKPQNKEYSELPENEDLTMRMAVGLIETPLHGLIYCADGSLTYFIKRFDRVARGNKIPSEDFAQLAGETRNTKYDFSMEKIIPIIQRYCTFPVLEKTKLLTRIIFNFLIGNEDMHLKNYSLITRENVVELAPAYDFINTTIAIGINSVKEEIALPLHGKKNHLTKKDIIEYYGAQKLELKPEVINQILTLFQNSIPRWKNLIEISFLSNQSKQEYNQILDQRIKILDLA